MGKFLSGKKQIIVRNFSIPLCFVCLFHFVSCRENVVSYALEQGVKQGSLVLKAKPIEEVLKNPSTDPKTQRFLELSQKVLSYARDQLQINVGKSYQKFYDIGRPWITKIVVAAHKDRLEPYLFKFPIVGSLPYKGFYDESDALQFQKELEDKGLDTYVRSVPAFSSLGWWPDPVLSTMFGEEIFFIELLFHELVHLNFYFDSEADFNEAFATWFAREVTVDFIEAHYESEQIVEFKKQLKLDLEKEMELISFLNNVKTKARSTYADAKNIEEARVTLFAWISDKAKSYKHLQNYSQLKWNNALIVSLNTYFQLYAPIENFAAKRGWSPVEFLFWVKKTGEKSVAKVVSEGRP